MQQNIAKGSFTSHLNKPKDRNLYIGGAHTIMYARDKDTPLHQMVKAQLLNSCRRWFDSIRVLASHEANQICQDFRGSGGPVSLVGVCGRLSRSTPLSLSTTF